VRPVPTGTVLVRVYVTTCPIVADDGHAFLRYSIDESSLRTRHDVLEARAMTALANDSVG